MKKLIVILLATTLTRAADFGFVTQELNDVPGTAQIMLGVQADALSNAIFNISMAHGTNYLHSSAWVNWLLTNNLVTVEQFQIHANDATHLTVEQTTRIAAAITNMPVELDPLALPRILNIEQNTSLWNEAYSWGNYLEAGYATTNALNKINQNLGLHTSNAAMHLSPEQAFKIEASITSAPPQNVVSVNSQTGAVVITAGDLGALTAEADPIALPRIQAIEQQTNAWNTAYSWGNHAAAGYATTGALADHTNDAAIHLTPEQAQRIANAVTNETDLAALRTYHYGSADIIESPAEWFTFNPATGTITAFNWQAGREHVVIPWEIGGVQVVKLDEFMGWNNYNEVVSVIAPKSVVDVTGSFEECPSLVRVSLPNATTVTGSFEECPSLVRVSLPNATTVRAVFLYCSSLNGIDLHNATEIYNSLIECPSLVRVSLPNATTVTGSLQSCSALTSVTFSGSPPTAEVYTFYNSPNVTVYVDNPTATGWGSTFAGRPVVRLPVTADSYTLPPTTATNMFLRLTASNEFIIVEEVFK